VSYDFFEAFNFLIQEIMMLNVKTCLKVEKHGHLTFSGWRVAACLKWAATLTQQEKNNSPVVQLSRENAASFVQ